MAEATRPGSVLPTPSLNQSTDLVAVVIVVDSSLKLATDWQLIAMASMRGPLQTLRAAYPSYQVRSASMALLNSVPQT